MSDRDPREKQPSAAEAARRSGRRAVMPPVSHASTILATSLSDFEAMRSARRGDDLTYGVHGTEGSYAFEEAIAELEGGWRTRLCSTGLTAVTAPILCYLSAGDHLLMPDTVYEPMRGFCDGMLKRLGVTTTYYDPRAGSGVRELIRPTTRMVYLESPGSLTFEVQDVRAIAAVAADRDCWTAMDNTWASPLYFKPLEHGVDISIQAVTKYLNGHADLVMGAVTTTKEAYPTLQQGWATLGLNAAPDDAYLAHRGMQTLKLRMERHWRNGLALAEWLSQRPEVAMVAHPALPDDPGHALWRRDFTGAGGLFAFTLRETFSNRAQIEALFDGLERFGLGFSWGGPESLLIPIDPSRVRTATRWPRAGAATGQMLRIHVGLDDLDLLTDDLRLGFARMSRAA